MKKTSDMSIKDWIQYFSNRDDVTKVGLIQKEGYVTGLLVYWKTGKTSKVIFTDS